MGLDTSSRHTVNPSAPAAGFSTAFPFGASDTVVVYRYLRANGDIRNFAVLEEAQTFTGALTLTAALTLSGAALNEAATVVVASAATTDIGAAASNNVDISGTATITSFGTAAEGINRRGRFTGILTLTQHATALILPGGANITTAVNDRYEARSLGIGNWIVTRYQRADGTALVAAAGVTGANPTATVSGTVVNGAATTFMRSDAAPALANTAVSAASYTKTSLTVDAQGRITAAASGAADPTGANPTATSTGAAINGVATTFMRSDAAFAIATATATVRGLVPTPPNNTTTFLRGDATFAVPSAGALILLSTVTAAGSATVDVETTFNSTYDAYMLVATNVTTTLGGLLQSRLRIGGVYNADASSYGWKNVDSISGGTGETITQNNAATLIQISPRDFASHQPATFLLETSRPDLTTSHKSIRWRGHYNLSNQTAEFNGHGGYFSLTSALTGIRFLTSAGVINTGTFRLYGIANS
ncbi:MAG: hypothetical protein DDT20_01702 [Firmicutes bacterium]|nr:hypothetical protein [Bacillota bacterium]